MTQKSSKTPTSSTSADVDSLAELLASVEITPAAAQAVIAAILYAGTRTAAAAAAAAAAEASVASSANVAPSAPPPGPPPPSPYANYSPAALDAMYSVPFDDEVGPFYVVTRGRDIGIFSGWENTSPIVTGVSGAVYRSIATVAEGRAVMRGTIRRGNHARLP